MTPLLYGELVGWYHLVDPPEDHEDEARCIQEAFERAVSPRPETLLDLGAGAGNNALHLKKRFTCTLADLSPDMLALSREQNPECEHVLGDLRTLRLGRQFDVVLVHDAITYMLTEEDLSAAVQTAFEHTRPGGATIIAPDCFRETFEDATEMLEADREGRSLRGLIWSWAPDPEDTTCRTEYAFLLREGGSVRAVHDRHVEGLFPRETWHRVLSRAGFQFETIQRPAGDGSFDDIFLCRRP
ncbi:methyltransferase domain-containing protein [Pyxidicoccus fallax]|uniref:Methyltransferase domain-containing protein n=1 Tax=Pyxidicoccus fallax TaxID=394095 RepID=A0A848LG03_9BACT|nr:class I SAM-dependent methyltransferase [Pyxidicoccus fallax]NMO15985.1 methyltransferase domain-containing protein [Pyxidicoccus fallax]NPC77399.1 methyltransferase domain-containing protein [Pyxidicoccus fallax]